MPAGNSARDNLAKGDNPKGADFFKSVPFFKDISMFRCLKKRTAEGSFLPQSIIPHMLRISLV